jgi:hypothetical protein
MLSAFYRREEINKRCSIFFAGSVLSKWQISIVLVADEERRWSSESKLYCSLCSANLRCQFSSAGF